MFKKLFTKGKIKPGITRNAPPKECEKLEIYIKEYKYNYSKTAAEEIKEFKEIKDITEAITNAATTMVGGKRHPHHYRKSKKTLGEAKIILIKEAYKISRINSFDKLHELIIDLLKDVPNIGPLYYYDTAFLIGAHLDKLPEKIYLHAGTKKGAKNMGINIRNKKYIEMEDISCREIFKKYCLKPYEIEDFLCIYKEALSFIF